MHKSWLSGGVAYCNSVASFLNNVYYCSEISRNEDQLSELLLYKDFLDSLAPPVSDNIITIRLCPFAAGMD